MIRGILRFFGYDMFYVCEWGIFRRRYDSIDLIMNRPIHKGMSVAPPWASRAIKKIEIIG